MKKGSILVMTAVISLLFVGCQKNQEPDEIELGVAAISKGAYGEALTDFQQAISQDENLIRAYRGEGMAYMGLGQYEQAIASFDLAIAETRERMKNTRKDILYYKASACYHQGDYEETIQVCNEILEIASEADAFYLRGTCYLTMGEEDKAQVDFDAAVKLQPEDYELYLNIYESYNDRKLSAKGDEYLQKALQIEDDSEEDTCDKAKIYYCLENYEEARKMLTPLVSEKNPEALLFMGKVYLALENPESSITMYQQYMEENEEIPEAYNGIVLANIAQGDYDTALQNIAKGLALETESGKQELCYNEIVAYEYKRDFDMAKVKAQAYIEKYPGDELGKKEYDFLISE